MPAPLHPREAERLAIIRKLGPLADLHDGSADDIALLARTVCRTPMAVTSIIDEAFQWYTGKSGVEPDRAERDLTFCQYTILQDDLLIVPDATQDRRFADNPFVTASDGIRFYAGIIIREPGGLPLGTLCVYSDKIQALDENQKAALRALGRQAELLVALRLANADLKELLGGMGTAKQLGLNAASDVLINPMAAMTLQLANLRRKHPALAADVAKIEASLQRTSDAVKGAMRDALPDL